MTVQGDAFLANALDENRAGRLTDAQRQGLRNLAGAWRRNELVGAGLSAIVGVVLITAAGPAAEATVRLAAGVALLVLAAFFLYRSLPGGDALTQDLRSGTVESVEGAVARSTYSGRTTTFHYLSVAGRRFETSRAIFDAAPEAGVVRLFFLPRSHHVVNLEQLADRPLPPGALESPLQAMASVMAGMRSHDQFQRADAMATMAAMEHAVEGQARQAAVPPLPGQRDPRPLAEAILGTWRAGPMTLTFQPDGSASADVMGQVQHGQWSVDGGGRLRFGLAGRSLDQAAEAWVAGDTLTVAEEGMGRTFQRVATA